MMIGLTICGLFVLVMVVCLICKADEKLPPPKSDERNWGINYTTDFKRWTERQ